MTRHNGDGPHRPLARGRRAVYLGLGWAFFGVGLIGAFLPVLPTTPFMILALGAFSKGSERLQHWLYHHRIFGPPLQRWEEHRVIPTKAKMMSLGAMTASFAYLAFVAGTSTPILVATGSIMLIGAAYILTKPGTPPGE